MEQKHNVTEISFLDIIKMFKGKGKILISTLLIFAVLGSGVAFIKTAFFGSFGNTVKFYITGVENSEDILSLLRSESFAEKLLLDENGMPPKETADSEAYDKAMAAVNTYNESRQQVHKLRAEFEAFDYSISLPDGTLTTMQNLINEHERLQKNYDSALSLLSLYKSASADAVAQDPNHLVKTAEYEEMLKQALDEKQSFETNVYQKALSEKSHLEQELNAKAYSLKKLRNEASAAVEEILAPWRADSAITRKVADIHRSMSFEHESYTKKDGENTENIAIISVDVSVIKDRELAKFIIEKLHTAMPDFVEKTAEQYEKNLNAKCKLITPFAEVHKLDEGDSLSNTARTGIICGLSALALYCVFVVVKSYIKRALEE